MKNRVVVPELMTEELLDYFHTFFIHPGKTKLIETLNKMYKIYRIEEKAAQITNRCIQCARNKQTKVKYGQIKGDLVFKQKFSTISIDIFGPVEHNKKKKYVLSIIDLVSKWVEFVQLESLKSEDVFDSLYIGWLRRYPLPRIIICDNGKSFKSETFTKKCGE